MNRYGGICGADTDVSQIAYYQKYVDEHSKNQLKQALVQYDRTLLVADNRRCEPKKFGGYVVAEDGRYSSALLTYCTVLARVRDTRNPTVKGWALVRGMWKGSGLYVAFAVLGLCWRSCRMND